MAFIIMNDEFVRLCEITTYKSLLWHPLFLDVTGGDFEFILPAEDYLQFIKKGYYIIDEDSDKFGIVDTYNVNDTDENGALITVKGEMGESILKRRIIWPSVSMSGTLDEVVGAIVRQTIINPTNTARRIPNFVYESNSEFDDFVSKLYTGNGVADAVVSLCGQFGYSYSVRLNDDRNGFVMKLIKGVDRSSVQSEYPQIVFSDEDYSISEFAYLTSDKAVFTHVICAGEGSGLSRKSVVYPTTSTTSTIGLNRREVFLDKQDLSSDAGTGEVLPNSTYMQKLNYEAAAKLQESSTDEACEGIIKQTRYVLNEDFNVGDIITIRNEKLGMEYDIRVLGALISVDENGARDVTAEMGNISVVEVGEDPDAETEVEEEAVVDTTQIYLCDDVRPFTFADSTLTEKNEIGLPTGWVRVYDNYKADIVLTSNANYYAITDDLQTIGTITFTLTKEQYAIAGEQIKKELNSLLFPVIVVTDSGITVGTVAMEYASATYSSADSAYLITCYTILNIGVPEGDFALLINGIRAIQIPEEQVDDGSDEEEITPLSWDISADGDGSILATIDTDDINTATMLTIIGSGATKDFSSDDVAPWRESDAHFSNISTVYIDSGVTYLGEYIFYRTGLINVELPETVRSIGSYAFAQCYDLTTVSMGDAVTSIGVGAFQASGLQQINLSSGLYTIQNAAFTGTALTTITIPAKCSYIGAKAFQLCTNMRTVYIGRAAGSTITVGANAFDFQSDNATIYVHDETIATALDGKYDEDVTGVVIY